MGDEVAAGEFDRLFAGTRQALEAVRTGGEGTAPEVRGVGTAADGLVRASVLPGGRLEAVTVSPRLLREGIEAVCEQIVLAVNAALDDLRTRAAEQRPAGAVDGAALAGQLRELQEESMRRMTAYGQALTDVLTQIRSAQGAGGR